MRFINPLHPNPSLAYRVGSVGLGYFYTTKILLHAWCMPEIADETRPPCSRWASLAPDVDRHALLALLALRIHGAAAGLGDDAMGIRFVILSDLVRTVRAAEGVGAGRQ